MPVTKITANGTYQLKTFPGYITAISVPSAGSAWTLQLFDTPGIAPGGSAQSQPIYGGTTAGAITTGLAITAPLYFGNSIQAILAGTTPGEIDIQWY